MNILKEQKLQNMKHLALERGGKCLSETYGTKDEKMEWECKDGHQWEALRSSIVAGTWCPKCATKKLSLKLKNQVKKIPQEKLQEYAKAKNGYYLLNKDLTQKDIAKWRCKNEHEWESKVINILRGYWCKECPKNKKGYKLKKLTLTDVQNIAKQKNGTCLSSEFKTLKDKLTWKCKEGHIWQTTTYLIKRGSWCPICAIKNGGQKRKVITINTLQEYAKERNGLCLSKEYNNLKDYIEWQCKKEHIWKVKTRYILYGKTWCPQCKSEKSRTQQRLTYEKLVKEFTKRGYKVLTPKKEYISAGSAIDVQCNNGHKSKKKYQKIKNGYGCAECSKTRGEKVLQKIVEEIFQTRFEKIRPLWLKRNGKKPLEIDCYSEKLQLGFEYQGRHHFKNTPWPKTLRTVKNNDAYKKRICNSRGIKLIRVPWFNSNEFHDHNKVINKVEKLIKRENIEIPAWTREGFNPVYLTQSRQEKEQISAWGLKNGFTVNVEIYRGMRAKEKWICNNCNGKPLETSWYDMKRRKEKYKNLSLCTPCRRRQNRIDKIENEIAA